MVAPVTDPSNALDYDPDEQPPLVRPGLKPIALSLAIGGLGGLLFDLIHIPLAWMLGPMIFNMVASVRGLPVLMPHGARVLTVCVVGVFIGGSFTPELLERAGEWILSLSTLLIFVPVITGAAALYYKKVAGFDGPTAAFSSAPGTLTAMVLTGGMAGADERLIALTQGLRVVVVVTLAPVIVTLMTGTAVLETELSLGNAGGSPWEGLYLVAAAVFGLLVAKVLGVQAASLTAAMFASAALYLSGTVTYRPPEFLLFIALWALGSAIGSRFSTVTPKTLFRVGRHALVATCLSLAIAGVFAGMIHLALGVPFLTALLSFAPGGVAEMCLIAITFDIDPAFVAMHHLARIVILISLAPIAAKLLTSSRSATP